MTDDFLRCALSKRTGAGEFMLDELDLAIDWPLMLRSREGATTAGGLGLLSTSSGNKENQLSGAMTASPWNMGEVS